MQKVVGVGSLLVLLATGGCASVIEGTDQQINVSTDPTGAACELNREGAVIARIPSTPGGATIEKTKNDIEITCRKEAYLDATCLNSSDYAGVGAANVLLGLLTMGVGFAVDSASGADNKYEPNVTMRMLPEGEAQREKTLLCTETMEDIYLEDVEAQRESNYEDRDS